MRRARSAVADGETISNRATMQDALTFDLCAPETADDENLSAQRVAMFELAPALLGATHFVWGLASQLVHPISIFSPLACNTLIPMAAVLLLDCAAFLLLWNRDRFGLAPL